MANADAAFGFRPVNSDGGPYTGQTRRMVFATTATAAAFVGDPVKLAAGDAIGGYQSVQQCAAADPVLGVITSFEVDPTALENLRFNIILRGEREARVFKSDIELKKGAQFGALQREAIVQFSNFFYDRICIKFTRVPSSWTIDSNELCNTISGAGQPSGFNTGTQSQQQESSGGSGNFNDF